MRLHALQAQFGDCLLLEYSEAGEARFILIDGGPKDTYPLVLRDELERLVAPAGGLELVILSHVDNDHAVGLIEMLSELRAERETAGGPEPLPVKKFWHNAFSQEIGDDVANRLADVVNNAPQMATASFVMQGFAEGGKLRLEAMLYGVSINEGFSQRLVSVDTSPQPIPPMGDLKLTVVGPMQANLDELRRKWLDWLDTHEDQVAVDPQVAAMADASVPNLSSIMVLAESGTKRMLLTGDGRGDHLLQGLQAAGLLDANGAIHVDVLKVAHHGSDRNTTKAFHLAVTADTYVVSANGKDGNPDALTLRWIVEGAHSQGRPIEIVATNETPSLTALRQSHAPATFGYTLTIKPQAARSITIDP